MPGGPRHLEVHGTGLPNVPFRRSVLELCPPVSSSLSWRPPGPPDGEGGDEDDGEGAGLVDRGEGVVAGGQQEPAQLQGVDGGVGAAPACRCACGGRRGSASNGPLPHSRGRGSKQENNTEHCWLRVFGNKANKGSSAGLPFFAHFWWKGKREIPQFCGGRRGEKKTSFFNI